MPSYSHLLDEERDQIAALKAAGRSIGAIAKAVGRAKSTVSRELRRNALPNGRSSPLYAAGAYQRRRRREAILERDRRLRDFVCDRLAEGWTPEQISGWLEETFPADERMQVSHETIYRSLFIQTRGALKKELMAHLRRTQGMRPRDTIRRRPVLTVESLMLFPSVSGLQQPKIVPYLVTGKAICCSVAGTARSRPWWSVNRATSCWQRSMAKIPRPSSVRSSGMPTNFRANSTNR